MASDVPQLEKDDNVYNVMEINDHKLVNSQTVLMFEHTQTVLMLVGTKVVGTKVVNAQTVLMFQHTIC